MLTVVVMPCRDEEAGLRTACASLGFDDGPAPPDAHLVLVDNGSRDGTWRAMSGVRDRAAPGSVTCVREPRHGHVPARVRGVRAAGELAAERGLTHGDVLLVQADADTGYGSRYVAHMAAAARDLGPGCLLEGRSVPPRPERDACADFRALEADVDAVVGPLLNPDEALDAIVDDKTAGFLLSDYLRWGGHRREFTSAGHEVLAETTRLWLRARAAGASRRHVHGATAVTSQRRILADPALAFATAGFPRDAGWVAAWGATYEGARGMEAFRPGGEAQVDGAIRSRVSHLIAMFRVLPDLVRAWEPRPITGRSTRAGTLEPQSPGRLLERAFAEAATVASDLMRDRPAGERAGVHW